MNDLNDIYGALPGLYDLTPKKTAKEQWPMSYAGSQEGMSLPIAPISIETPTMSKPSSSASPFSTISGIMQDLSTANMFKTPAPIVLSGGNSEFQKELLKKMQGQYQQAQNIRLFGAGLKTIAAAGDLFSTIYLASEGWKNAHDKAENTKRNVANQMAALDNQVMYYRNQVADKFNEMVARNTVTMAASNLRVTAANLLEQTKGAAVDMTEDIKTAESNARLKKIALESEARQAEVAKKLEKSQLIANVVQSVGQLGWSGATTYGMYKGIL